MSTLETRLARLENRPTAKSQEQINKELARYAEDLAVFQQLGPNPDPDEEAKERETLRAI